MKNNRYQRKRLFRWLMPVLLLSVILAGETFAESFALNTQNEFIGVRDLTPADAVEPIVPISSGEPDSNNPIPPAEESPNTPANPVNPDNSANPPNPSNPSHTAVPAADTQSDPADNTLHNPSTPEIPLAQLAPPVTPAEPIDPTGQPKTADMTNPRTWLISMATCAFLLRYALLIRKRRE